MNLRQTYLDAAEYVRKHGFSPKMRDPDGRCCFFAALHDVGSDSSALIAGQLGELLHSVPEFNCGGAISGRVHSVLLEREGWTTEDAIAAFEIAADLAAP